MRIIGGELSGRRLAAPPGQGTRPTTDRIRENLFNILSHRFEFQDARVIDLFAGSGALGLEALSRDAEFCLFVETASKPIAAIRQNLEQLNLGDRAKLIRRDASRLGSCGSEQTFDIAFADPPYGKGLGTRAAKSLVQGNWLSDNALFILEEATDAMPEKINNFNMLEKRSYGATTIGIFELAPAISI